MSLLDHARRELELLGEDAETIDWYLNVIKAFSGFGHSGGSASIMIPVLNELFQHKNLTPLTDDPTEWVHHNEACWGEPNGIWQNNRNSEAFSNDGGKTYYLLSEKTPIHESKKVT